MEQQAYHLYLLHRWRIGFVCVCVVGLAFSLSLLSSSSRLLHHNQFSWLQRLLFKNPMVDSSSSPLHPPLSILSHPQRNHSISPSPVSDYLSSSIDALFPSQTPALLPSSLVVLPPSTQAESYIQVPNSFEDVGSQDLQFALPPTESPMSASTSAQMSTDFVENVEIQEAPAPSSAPTALVASVKKLPSSASASRSGGSVHCDMSVGKWVYDGRNYPLYQPRSCPFVDEAFSCQENGRLDSDYLKWRWQPQDCDIPRFNAQNLLQRLRGKRMVFAGDSLVRNQWESMLCLLQEGLDNKSRVQEMRGHRITKGKGDYVFKFLDYNLRVEFYRSHFLVAEGTQKKVGSQKPRLTLRIDTIDKTSKKWRQADILIFTTGHWWTHGKTLRGKDYFQEGEVVYESFPVMMAFKKAMKTWGSWVDKNINPKLTKVFFCSYSPSHFNGGQWNSGGQCHNERDPIFNESFIPSYPEKMLAIEDIIGHMKNPVQLLNVTRFSEFRKDSHPSIYGQVPRNNTRPREDCSHWCLPGVPDIWNEVLHSFL